ncbi:MAG: SusC/RagA family TonB-linked outer membrane protein, partial [Mariniphaga sp.]
MKLTVLLLCISTLASIASTGYAQSTKLTVIKENATVKSILDEIQNQSEFKFFFSSEVDVDRTTSINMKNKAVFDILDELFKETNVNYVVFDRQIALVVQPKSGVNDDFSAIGMQQPAVKGKVTDAAGQPLPGVTVVVKGTARGTVTNADGDYSLTNIPEDATLVFSFVGMRTEEIAVGNQTTINVTMEEETIGIDEVVAIGYGTVKKSDLTGSVSSVKAEDLQATPITSIDQGLVGRAAGVMVTQTSGMPGAIASIRVRGTSSLQGGNEPLYVIDGFPVYNGTGFGETGGSTSYSGLSTINPSDIESIEILKDASATSIYGARAANGVVLITTKNGRRGTDIITFNATYGIQNVVKKIDVMNAIQYAELVNEAYTNDGLPPVYDEAEMQQIRQNPEGTNWQDEVFRSAPSQNYQLTFSGGDQKMIYSVSANYYDQEGIIRSSDFKRYSGRINLERNILANFRVGTNFTMSKTISNAVRTNAGAKSSLISSAMKFNPISPVFINEELKIYTPVNSPGVVNPNPVATADEMIRENQAVRILGNIFGEWEIISDLKAKVSFGTDLFNTKFNTYIPSNIYESEGVASA